MKSLQKTIRGTIEDDKLEAEVKPDTSMNAAIKEIYDFYAAMGL
jgi:hypothetical protein